MACQSRWHSLGAPLCTLAAPRLCHIPAVSGRTFPGALKTLLSQKAMSGTHTSRKQAHTPLCTQAVLHMHRPARRPLRGTHASSRQQHTLTCSACGGRSCCGSCDRGGAALEGHADGRHHLGDGQDAGGDGPQAVPCDQPRRSRRHLRSMMPLMSYDAHCSRLRCCMPVG